MQRVLTSLFEETASLVSYIGSRINSGMYKLLILAVQTVAF